MKMKNIIAFAGAVILMLASSCNKDYLDKNPLDKISGQTFWNNKLEVDMAVSGCYSRLYGSLLDYQRAYLDALGDCTYNYWGFFNTENMVLGLFSKTSGGAPNDIWNTSYRGIAQCNFFLDNVDKAVTVDKSYLAIAKAEVQFLRAMFYFDLVNCFGEVPLYKTSPENAEASKIARNPKAEVLAFIHADLDFAIANLPNDPYFKGHAVKGSAQGLKTRVLITEKKWTETAALAQQIMNSGIFSVYGDYEAMFLKKGQKNNPEIMFACEYLGPERYHSTYGMNIEYAKHIFLTKYLKNAFECSDGLPITESPLYDPTNTFKNRDPRHNLIVRNPKGTDWLGHYPYDFYDVTGVQNRKYIDPTIQGNYVYNYLNDWNYILIRYSDILLMYAEAQNEVTGPNQSIYNAINAVRQRTTINMPPVDQARYNSKDKLREYIQHERMVEFPMEGLRYFDLKRWNIAHIVLPKLTNPGGYPYVFEQKHYLWPIQQSEMDKNSNLVQTTGY